MKYNLGFLRMRRTINGFNRAIDDFVCAHPGLKSEPEADGIADIRCGKDYIAAGGQVQESDS